MIPLFKQSLRLGKYELIYHYLPGEATRQDVADERNELSRAGCHWVKSGPCVIMASDKGMIAVRPVSGMRELKEGTA